MTFDLVVGMGPAFGFDSLTEFVTVFSANNVAVTAGFDLLSVVIR